MPLLVAVDFDPFGDPLQRLIWSGLLTVVGIVVGIGLTRVPKRTDDAPLWSGAILAAVVVFAWMLLAYAIVPDAFIQWADADLQWTRDAYFYGGPDGAFPFAVTRQAVRDILVVGIYGVFLVANIAFFVLWQKRPTADAESAEATSKGLSRFRRPVKAGA